MQSIKLGEGVNADFNKATNSLHLTEIMFSIFIIKLLPLLNVKGCVWVQSGLLHQCGGAMSCR